MVVRVASICLDDFNLFSPHKEFDFWRLMHTTGMTMEINGLQAVRQPDPSKTPIETNRDIITLYLALITMREKILLLN